MSTTSKAAANRSLIKRTVVAALRTQGPALSDALAERIYDGNPPQNLTLKQFLLDLAAYLERSTDEAAHLSAAVLTEEAEDLTATATKNEALGVTRDEIGWQRDRIEGTYGSATAKQFGFAGTLPTATDELTTLCTTLANRLRKNEFPPKTRLGRPALDRHEMADRIEQARGQLVKLAKANEEEKRETQQARDERNVAEDDWSLDYRGVANIAVGLFILARKVALAEKVRPTSRRRQGLPEDEDLEEPAQPEPTDDVVEPVAE